MSDIAEGEGRAVPDDTFTCASCGVTLAKVGSDEDVAAEARARGIDPSAPGATLVCDDCFYPIRRLLRWHIHRTGRTERGSNEG